MSESVLQGLLRAATSPDASAAEAAWVEFRNRARADHPEPQHREVFPAIHANFARLGLPRDAVLAAEYLRTFGGTQRGLQEASRLLGLLAAEGFAPLILGPAALFLRGLAPGQRPWRSLALLAEEGKFSETVGVLARSGFSLGAEAAEGTRIRATLSRPDLPNASIGFELDVYRRPSAVLNYPEAVAALGRQAETRLLGTECRIPSRVDHLLHILIGNARFRARPSALWMLDCAWLLSDAGEGDIENLAERAREFDVGVLARHVARLAAQAIPEDPMLRRMAERLGQSPVTPHRALEAWLHRRPAEQGRDGLLRLWFSFDRSTPPKSRKVSDFPRFLAREWNIDVRSGLVGGFWKELVDRANRWARRRLGLLPPLRETDAPMTAEDVHRLGLLKGRHLGAPAVVFGNGWSLRQYAGFRLKPGVVGIGVNFSPQIIEAPYHVHYDWVSRAPDDYPGVRVGPVSLAKYLEPGQDRGILALGSTWWRANISPVPSVVSSQSGISGIELAVFMGCRPIYLVGFDGNQEGAEGHFYGAKPAAPSLARMHNVWISYFRAYHPEVPIIQTNPRAAIQGSEGGDTSAVLFPPEEDAPRPKPLLVGAAFGSATLDFENFDPEVRIESEPFRHAVVGGFFPPTLLASASDLVDGGDPGSATDRSRQNDACRGLFRYWEGRLLGSLDPSAGVKKDQSISIRAVRIIPGSDGPRGWWHETDTIAMLVCVGDAQHAGDAGSRPALNEGLVFVPSPDKQGEALAAAAGLASRGDSFVILRGVVSPKGRDGSRAQGTVGRPAASGG